jgi:hypothetical protein
MPRKTKIESEPEPEGAEEIETVERLHSQAYASEQKQLEENLHVYDDKTINELYEIEKDIFDEEIAKITKSFFG